MTGASGTLQVGLFGVEIPVEVNGTDVQRTGDEISIVGIFQGHPDNLEGRAGGPAYTEEQITVLAQQLLGLTDPVGEPVKPFRCTLWDVLDGFVEVLVADVGIERDQASLGGGAMPWALQLKRIPHYQSARVGGLLLGRVRTNSHSITTANLWHAAPVGTVYGTGSYDPDGSGAVPLNRNGPDGVQVGIVGEVIADASTTITRYPTYPIRLYEDEADEDNGQAHRYHGAAVVRYRPTGSTKEYHLVGGQPATDVDYYVISNGLFELRVTAPNGPTTSIHVRGYDATPEWGPWIPVQWGSWDGADDGIIEHVKGHGWQVITNSGDRVLVRQMAGIASNGGDAALEIQLRRGAHFFDLRSSSRTSLIWATRIDFGAEPDWTGTTGGRVTSTDDDDGNRWAMFSTVALTGSGPLMRRSSTATEWFHAVGFIKGGGSAAQPNRIQDVRGDYFAQIAVWERPG